VIMQMQKTSGPQRPYCKVTVVTGSGTTKPFHDQPIAQCSLCRLRPSSLEDTPHIPCNFEVARRLAEQLTDPRIFPGLFAKRIAPPFTETSPWRATLRRDADTEAGSPTPERSEVGSGSEAAIL